MQLHFTISEKKKGEIDTFTFIHTLLALVGHKQTTTKVKKKKNCGKILAQTTLMDDSSIEYHYYL